VECEKESGVVSDGSGVINVEWSGFGGEWSGVRDNLNGPSVIMNIHIPDGPARMCRQPARPAPGERA
jgi:hypothetical protein